MGTLGGMQCSLASAQPTRMHALALQDVDALDLAKGRKQSEDVLLGGGARDLRATGQRQTRVRGWAEVGAAEGRGQAN